LLFDVGCNLTISTIFFIQSRVLFDRVVDAVIPPEIRRFFYPRIIEVDGVKAFAISKTLQDMPKPDNATTMMAEIIRKTLLVSIVISFSTITNLIALVVYNATEHGWLCFLMCTSSSHFLCSPKPYYLPALEVKTLTRNQVAST
jgi:hypothetical protein